MRPRSAIAALLASIALHAVLVAGLAGLAAGGPHAAPSRPSDLVLVQIRPAVPAPLATDRHAGAALPASSPSRAPAVGEGPARSARSLAAAAPVAPGSAAPTSAAAPALAPPPKLDLDWSGFEQVFGDDASRDRAAFEAGSLDRRRHVAPERMPERTARALAANSGWIAAGNGQVLGARQTPFGTYLSLMSDRIRVRFGESLFALASPSEKMNELAAGNPVLTFLFGVAPSDPLERQKPAALADPNLHSLAEVELLDTGKVSEVRLIRTSGNTVFDALSVDSIYGSSPFVRPPSEILSYNKRLYLRWNFHRDFRRWGPANAEAYILDPPDAGPPLTR